MTTQRDHEEGTVSAFVLPVRRSRYLEFLKAPRTRKRFTSELAHFKHLDPRRIVPIPGRQQNPASISELLVAKGADSECWVISENREIDGQEMELIDALEETVGRGMGTFISCIPRRLAYFEPEYGPDRCILQA